MTCRMIWAARDMRMCKEVRGQVRLENAFLRMRCLSQSLRDEQDYLPKKQHLQRPCGQALVTMMGSKTCKVKRQGVGRILGSMLRISVFIPRTPEATGVF